MIRPAVRAGSGGTWADFGAGTGTFSEALLELLGAAGRVIAIERDARALRALNRLAGQWRGALDVVAGDVLQLDAIPGLLPHRLDGALFANVLHFFAAPEIILADARRFLRPAANIIIVEYERRSASRWVPYPLPFQRLAALAEQAGLGAPKEIGRRASRYQGELYCAVVQS